MVLFVRRPVVLAARPPAWPQGLVGLVQPAKLWAWARGGIIAAAALSAVLIYAVLLGMAGVPGHNAGVFLAAFCAAAISGIIGFAFSAICGTILFHLHVSQMPAVQIMMICSACIQLYMVVALWRSIEWFALLPFLAGGILGLPFGLALLIHANPTTFAELIGALLSGYSLYMAFRPDVTIGRRRSPILDCLVGFLGGITGGAAAFPAGPVTVWGQVSGWPRSYQRGVYQPFILVMQILALGAMFRIGAAAPASPTLVTAGLAVPPALAGTWLGLRWYRRVNDRQFSKVVIGLLLFSGVTLLL